MLIRNSQLHAYTQGCGCRAAQRHAPVDRLPTPTEAPTTLGRGLLGSFTLLLKIDKREKHIRRYVVVL
jgi:hypothetical protein